MSRLVVFIVLFCPLSAAAQTDVVALSDGWSLHRSVGISSAEDLACARESAFLRDWTGTVAHWNGDAWATLPRRPEYTYGRSIAASPDGQVFLEGGATVAHWDGARWRDWPLEPWQGDLGSALAAPSGDQAYYPGRGRIAIFDGTRFRTFAAGTWRSLSAVAVSNGIMWVGGQGGTILRHGAGWSREDTGTDAWIRRIVAFAVDDVWAIAGERLGNDSIVLHYDGTAWSRRQTTGEGRIWRIGGTAAHVYGTSSTTGLLRWVDDRWVTEIAQADLGDDANYYRMLGVCATDHHVIVSFGPHALVRARR